MQRIVIIGGGVGGTLAANLLARELGRQIDSGEVSLTVVDALGEHVYQPGFMYIAMGNQKPSGLVRPERSLLDKRIRLEVGEVTRIDTDAQLVNLASGERLAYDQLVLASGCRIVPELIPGLIEEAHHFYGWSRPSGCGRRSTRSPAAES
jgi:sulfide:quinone oxidoreductase